MAARRPSSNQPTNQPVFVFMAMIVLNRQVYDSRCSRKVRGSEREFASRPLRTLPRATALDRLSGVNRMTTPQTSQNSPLRIAAVTPGDGHGRIGITLCPGKTDPNGMSGAWARDLDTDLDAIQRWGATAIVTLITDEEIDYLKIPDLQQAVRDRHMEWWHLPIQDGKSPPAQGFEDKWADDAGEALRDRLRLGFDVLVHCRGGLGRAEP